DSLGALLFGSQGLEAGYSVHPLQLREPHVVRALLRRLQVAEVRDEFEHRVWSENIFGDFHVMKPVPWGFILVRFDRDEAEMQIAALFLPFPVQLQSASVYASTTYQGTPRRCPGGSRHV